MNSVASCRAETSTSFEKKTGVAGGCARARVRVCTQHVRTFCTSAGVLHQYDTRHRTWRVYLAIMCE